MLYLSLKLATSILLVLVASIWFGSKLVINSRRDLHPIALNGQANVGPTRKEKETAVYRNFTVPPGFPLSTGLGLSMGYKLRNGNFGDIWSNIMSLSARNYVELSGREYSVKKINALAKCLSKFVIQQSGSGRLGIAAPIFELPGFTVAIAGFMSSLSNVVPVFLTSVPRSKQELDILAIDSWTTFHQMNGSCEWYKIIIVCNENTGQPPQTIPQNVVTWKDLVSDQADDPVFEYAPPKDNCDDAKLLAITSSPWNLNTSFSHMALVSSVSAFIKSFPMDNEISGKDHLTVVIEEATKYYYPIQVWTKLLTTLLHGGSTSILFIKPNETDLQSRINEKTSLLQIDSSSPLLDSILQSPTTAFKKVKLGWALSLLSEGIFTSSALSHQAFQNMRCMFLSATVGDTRAVTAMEIPSRKLQGNAKGSRSTLTLNKLRALLGSRLIVELYSPFVVMGPIACTNFFDYRVLPESVDSRLSHYGPIGTSLEAKLVEDEHKPELQSSRRQGMLCIRGFTIGKPVEPERLERAIKIVEKFDGGEGWMPMLGVYGLFGKDGCFYEFK
ncbi:LAQU0S11e02366g1_1 [Lachancea quebecensis]|uniref:LAQU0S11e02366g1_1 n=1 Tax=Lachancea quebecensis TaxID=1654605 RepID=A0A0P1KTY0_9SACH|nr:LAQU0S11e02366g1_1 [Lachancea quebecensis]